MDSIKNLLGNQKKAPDGLEKLKSYIWRNYKVKAKTAIYMQKYQITVESAPLASTLQLEKLKIEKECELDKPLRIKIGSVAD